MPASKKTAKRYSNSRSQSSKSKKGSFGVRSNISKKQILIFVLLFAIIGSALLWWSFAATGAVLNNKSIDPTHSSPRCSSSVTANCYSIPPPENSGVKRNTTVMQLTAGSVASPTEVSVFDNNFDKGIYKVCLFAKSLGAASSGQFKVFSYSGGPSATALATSTYNVPITATDYKQVACIPGIRFDGTSPGMEVSVLNQSAAIRLSSAVVYKTGDITPPPPNNCHPGDPLSGVQDPGRLGVTKNCQTITGHVCKLEPNEADSDNAFDIILDTQYQSLLNSNNVNFCGSGDGRLALHLETIPQDQAGTVFHSPNAETLALKVGDYVSVTGPLVQDNGHSNPGWTEIHPVEFITVITPQAAVGAPLAAPLKPTPAQSFDD